MRLTNPTARIEIACDQQTLQALQADGSQQLREADIATDLLYCDTTDQMAGDSGSTLKTLAGTGV